MKDFEEIIKENGLKKPWLRREKFLKAEQAYSAYCTEFQKRNARWEEIRRKIKKEWGVDVAVLSELEEFGDSFKFETWDEAIKLINKTKARMIGDSLYEVEKIVVGRIRAEWINELVKKAPANCELIVIKDKNYKPRDELIKNFDNALEKRETASICDMFVPIWISFKPQDTHDATWWGMNKATSTVEYV